MQYTLLLGFLIGISCSAVIAVVLYWYITKEWQDDLSPVLERLGRLERQLERGTLGNTGQALHQSREVDQGFRAGSRAFGAAPPTTAYTSWPVREPPPVQEHRDEYVRREPDQHAAKPHSSSGPGASLVQGGTPGFSMEAVRQAYREWCERGLRPDGRTMEVQPLRLAKVAGGGELSAPVAYFEDSEQIGDLVRFSPPGEPTGFALPHPEARHSREALRAMFRDLNEGDLQHRSQLATVMPVRIQKRGPYWEKV